MRGKVMVAFGSQPSTRTLGSFRAAMLMLGGKVNEFVEEKSSMAKGESFKDTLRVISNFGDIIVMRHPGIEAAENTIRDLPVPFISAGGGIEHPTQALLDIYTVTKEMGEVRGLKIAFVRDLRYGRVIPSWVYLLPIFEKAEVFLVSPPELALPQEYKNILKINSVRFLEADWKDFSENILSKIDVLMVTRIQKENLHPDIHERVRNFGIVDGKVLRRMKSKAIIMHPLPRVDEIAEEVDTDSRAAYFRQVENGLYTRMALLKMIFGGPL